MTGKVKPVDDFLYKIKACKAEEYLAQLPSDSVHLTVTSPPYDQLRNYLGKHEVHFKKVIEELYRVTVDGGVVVWVINDQCFHGGKSGSSFRQALHFMKCGFRLHDTMIFEKSGVSMPSKDRYFAKFDYMFVFKKGNRPRVANMLCDRLNTTVGQRSHGKQRDKDGKLKPRSKKRVNLFGKRFNIWKIFTGSKNATNHPATFPLDLPQDHILTWTNPDEIVLDPFMGSGTTAMAALNTSRKWLGCDANEEYVKKALWRIHNHGELLQWYGSEEMPWPRKYRETHYPKDTIEVCQENLDLFYKFMHKRHMIWYRRFIKKLPQKKWTKDKILKETKYTNIYRELDRGTIWFIQMMLEPLMKKWKKIQHSKKKRFRIVRELIWRSCVYRLCNRIETFEAVGMPKYKDFDPEVYLAKLNERGETGHSVMTSAHVTCPTPKGLTKIQGYVLACKDLHGKLNKVTKQVLRAKTHKKIFETFKQIHCVGHFTAYEMLCDLMYAKVLGHNGKIFTEDDWANVGPGAKEGVRLIFPSTKGNDKIYKRMLQLRDEQHKHFKRLEIEFKFYEKYAKGHLSLRSLEHALCEYQKYWLQRKGLGKVRMKLKVNDDERWINDRKLIVDPDCGDRLIYVHRNNDKSKV